MLHTEATTDRVNRDRDTNILKQTNVEQTTTLSTNSAPNEQTDCLKMHTHTEKRSPKEVVK